MKIGRRSFLSFVIGGAAGTALTPLPWKLTDDLSIWTQMWPWTPVPEDGESHYVDSVCTLCPGGCGISVRKIDERAVKIEGVKGHPINNGGVCALGLSGLQLLYAPAWNNIPGKQSNGWRIPCPMKRVNGGWQKISWESAIEEIVKYLGELRTNGEPHTVGCIADSEYGTVPHLFNRFLKSYGSANFMRMPSVLDSYEMALKIMHGVDAVPGFDLENVSFVLSFGSGILDGWGSPVRMFKANSLWRDNKAKVIQIEPRLSNTAAKADKWIPIKVGQEAAFAIGIAYFLIKNNMHNRYFAADFSADFEGFKKIIFDSFEKMNIPELTGVDAATIETVAKDFGTAANPLAICGRGRGNTPVSLHEAALVHSLNAIVGNINQKGGIWAVPKPDYIRWTDPALDDIAKQGIEKGRMDEAGSQKYPYAGHLTSRFASFGGNLKALFVLESNPLYNLPDTKAVKEAFSKIPLVVSFSSFMDETAANANLILPNHAYLERYEDVPAPFGLNKPYIGISRPVVKPALNTKHAGDVILNIAKAMGGSIAEAFPWKDYDACLKETIAADWGVIDKTGFLFKDDYRPADWSNSFKTSSGKFEFLSSAYQHKGEGAMNAAGVEGDKSVFPLILISYDSMRVANGFIGNPPFATKTVENTVLNGKYIVVEVNPKTAGLLREGDIAVLTTPKGNATVKVHLFEGIEPGVVAMVGGLGHTAYDDYLAGKGVNVNDLIGIVEDKSSGMDVACGIRARLEKA